MGQDMRPAGVFRVWGFWDDPKAVIGMVNEGNGFLFGGSQRPGPSEEVESVVVVEASLKMDGQVEVQQGGRRDGV